MRIEEAKPILISIPPSQVNNGNLRKSKNRDAPTITSIAPEGSETSTIGPEGLRDPIIQEIQKLSPEIESAVDSWLSAYRKLERVGGKKWGGEEAKKVFSLAADAEEALLGKDLKKAEKQYSDAANLANSLYHRRHDYLLNLLATGTAALTSGKAADAVKSFGLALLIDPDHKEALKGAERAKTLDQVTALVDRAKEQESAEHFGIARALFLEALALDQDCIESVEGVKRSNEAMEEIAFRGRISEIFDKLEKGELDSAQESLLEAAALKPGSLIPQETAKLLTNALQIKRVQNLKQRANSAEKIEDWEGAFKIFAEIQQWIPDSKVAWDGQLKARTILELQAELSHYINEPKLLLSEDSRASARLALQKVKGFTQVSTILKSGAEKLMAIIKTAETPIPVTLFSDGQTEVVIFRVRELGKFRAHELSLRPGSYTVLGTREGYRDFRGSISIEPGDDMVELTVRCEESIF